MRIRSLSLIFLAAATPAFAQDRDHCRHEAQRSANIDINNAQLLVVDAGAGSLKI